MPEDQQKSNNNAITLADTRNDFDFFDWSWSSALPPPPTSRESPGPARQHLRAQTREYGAYNFGRIAAGSIYGGSTPSRQSHDGDHTSKLDSHHFSGIDLQLDLDNDVPVPNNDYGTPEVGRRDSSPFRQRSLSQFRGASRDKSAPAETFEPIDLQLDLVIPTMPDLDDVRSRRACKSSLTAKAEWTLILIASALSTPPPASPPAGLNDITPRMAAKIAGFPAPRDRSSPAAPKAKKARLVQADDALELDDDELAMNRDLSDILTVERYIPADPTITRMREIMDDPAGHFLPSLTLGGDNMFYVGPRDLAPELEELFTFPSNILRKRSDQSQQDERQNKRARTEEGEQDLPADDDIEVGRRQSVLPSEHNFGLSGENDYLGGDQTFDDIQQGLEDSGPSMDAQKRRLRTPSVAPSVTETIARQIQDQRSTGGHDLAMFEKDARDEAASQSQALTTPSKSVASEPISKTSSGYSRNTGMAMGLLRREIEAIEQEDKVVGLNKLADKVSLRPR